MALIGNFDSIVTDKKLHEYIVFHLQDYFKNVPGYEQFTRGIRSISKYLDFMIETLCQLNFNPKEGFYIIDSTALSVNDYNKNEVPRC